MEDALGDNINYNIDCANNRVLILVVMEDALGEDDESGTFTTKAS